VRAVLDANVLVSALLSREGAPAQLLQAWRSGHFELVVSPQLLGELARVFEYPKLRRRIEKADADAFVDLLRSAAVVAGDAGDPPRRAADPDDDYLIALAAQERAILVSGDRDLLELASRYPVRAPRDFVDSL
jgi:uncharacterized protein